MRARNVCDGDDGESMIVPPRRSCCGDVRCGFGTASAVPAAPRAIDRAGSDDGRAVRPTVVHVGVEFHAREVRGGAVVRAEIARRIAARRCNFYM